MRVGTDYTRDTYAAWPRPERAAAPARDPQVFGAELPWGTAGADGQPEAKLMGQQLRPEESRGLERPPADGLPENLLAKTEAKEASGQPRSEDELTDKEKDVVARLKQRDIEVRNHEAAHMAAAGAFGGGASFSYVTGPDGNRYAVGGEVPVRMVGGRTPEEAIRNAAQVRAAALAPAEPSGQDQAVAAAASAMEADARAELAAQRAAEAAAADPSRRAREAEAPRAPAPTRPAGEPTSATGQAAETTASNVVEQTTSARPSIEVPADPEATVRQLEQERLTSRGSYRHMHLASGCGSCAAAVGAYT